MEDKIIILDFGSQYTHLLARRIRQLNVYSEIRSPLSKIEELKQAKGIILSGGPSSVYDKKAPRYNKDIFKLKIPILGLCYGHQLMCHIMGGDVKQGKTKEYGTAELNIQDKSSLLKDLNNKEIVWMSHGDTVAKLPTDFKTLGTTDDCPTAAIGNEKLHYYGLQFHPEVTHTPNGQKIFENFISLCKCKRDWTIHNYIEEKVKEIKQQSNSKNIFLLVSGGVDSTVVFALLNKALGTKRVYGLHIDNGFVRKDESKDVESALKKLNFNNFHVVDETNTFLEATKGIIDPEKKREAIGKTFVDVANKAIKDLDLDPDHWILAQGTIYPDTIETAGTEHAAKIKTHHNRVEEIQKLIDQGKVIEPIAQLYKDEVRELGIELGLPKDIVWRHPFPGPGLAVRVLCSDGKEKINNEKEINNKITEICKRYNVNGFILPIQSVGVQGDARTYRHPALITGKADWKALEKLSTELTNNLKEINRVLWLIHPKEINNIKTKKSYLTKDRLDLLREADYIVNTEIEKRNLTQDIWQFPVVLVPLSINDGESIVLRPVSSKEAMTARFFELPLDVVNDIAEKITKISKIDAVFYDITHKPPGTIEWE